MIDNPRGTPIALNGTTIVRGMIQKHKREKGPAMRSAASNEIEYLGRIEGALTENPRLIREMSQRLDALRRFDQSFCDADCRPHAGLSNWEPDSPCKVS